MTRVVLIIDDDAETRRLLALTLKAVGFETVVAGSGAVASQKVHGLPAGSLVVCDRFLGASTGVEVRTYLRDARPDLAFVMVGEAASGAAAGFDFAVVPKPVDPRMLQSTALAAVG